METGKYLDFHSTDDRDTDYNVRMVSYDDGTLDVIKAAGQPATITANLNGTANFASQTLFDKAQWVSLTSLDQNTWYPVVSMNSIVTQLTAINETLKAKNTDSGTNGGEKT